MIDEPDKVRSAFEAGQRASERPRRTYYPVLRPAPGQEVTAIILSETVQIAHTHYQHPHKTYPCVGPEQGCPWCKAHVSPKTHGYLCGINCADGKLSVVELTANALRQCPGLADPKHNLRGCKLWLKRRGLASNGPVVASIQSNPPDRVKWQPLPSPFFLRSALLVMWSMPPLVNEQTGEVYDPVPTWEPRPVDPARDVCVAELN